MTIIPTGIPVVMHLPPLRVEISVTWTVVSESRIRVQNSVAVRSWYLALVAVKLVKSRFQKLQCLQAVNPKMISYPRMRKSLKCNKDIILFPHLNQTVQNFWRARFQKYKQNWCTGLCLKLWNATGHSWVVEVLSIVQSVVSLHVCACRIFVKPCCHLKLSEPLNAICVNWGRFIGQPLMLRVFKGLFVRYHHPHNC